MSKGIALGLAWALCAACSPYSSNGAFACTDNSQCDPNGTCSDGFCAFADSGCTSGLKYGNLAGSLSNTCVGGGGSGIDGGSGVDAKVFMDAHLDSPPGQFCYGSGIVSACFATAPTGTMTLSSDIDTAGGGCATTLNATGACVVAAGTIDLNSGVTVHAHGTKPLVLVATMSITIAGTLDVSSTRGGMIGAGADANGCDAGTAAAGTGGGAGGSFGTRGGNGGITGGGTSGNTLAPTALRGGCPGQDGAGGGGGTGAHGGGAAYLIATTSIFVSGTINASGEGANNANTNSNSGGGGGGAGGYVGLESASVTSTGVVVANGGGGGEASGAASTGTPGGDPNPATPTTAAAGGGNTSSFGTDGGNGFAGATGAQPGSNVCTSPCTTPASGGGGGGGAGIIRVVPSQSIGGQASPTPS